MADRRNRTRPSRGPKATGTTRSAASSRPAGGSRPLTLGATVAARSPEWMTPRRAVALALVVCMLALTLTVPLRTYFSQRSEAAQLTASNANLQREIESYQQKVNEQNDPAYIEAQARERLQFVMPGDKALVMQYPQGPQKSEDEVAAEKRRSTPWYTTMWGSLSAPSR